jgi:hypothetical protein
MQSAASHPAGHGVYWRSKMFCMVFGILVSELCSVLVRRKNMYVLYSVFKPHHLDVG